MNNIISHFFGRNNNASSITKIDPALKKSDANKLRAATALNMCTASVSEIVAKKNLVAMELEYNNILNNLNMESIIKDEALLRVMRKLLDTISFFRLNEMERKRLEQRHERKMGGAIMDKLLASGPSLVLCVGNPVALATTAVVAGASMYANKKKEDAKEQEKFEDKMWELERAAIEQLNALRVELFECAWRLSDAYGFKDSWRLTEKQIDWFNEARGEYDPFLRYVKLNQRRDDFSVYPQYWYELGCAALEVTQMPVKDVNDEDEVKRKAQQDVKKHYIEEAKACFEKYIECDPRLLRQDYFAADARLKYISIIKEELGGWAQALLAEGDKLMNVRRLSLDNSELLLKTAMIYGSAFIELMQREKESGEDSEGVLSESEREDVAEWYKQAISCLEILVMRGSALPVSSVLLSLLQRINGDKLNYDRIQRIKEVTRNAKMILVDYNADAGEVFESLGKCLSDAGSKSVASVKTLIVRAFAMVVQLADPAFNVPEDEQRKVLQKWAVDTKDFRQGMTRFWEILKVEFNSFFIFVGREYSKSFGADARLEQIAKKLNDVFTEEMRVEVENKPDVMASAAIRVLDHIRNAFRDMMCEFIESLGGDGEGSVSTEDFRGALSFYIDSVCSRKHIVGVNKDGRSYDSCRRDYFYGINPAEQEDDEQDEWEPSLFGADREFIQDGLVFEFSKIDHAEYIERLVERKLSYTITFNSVASEGERYRLVEDCMNTLEIKYSDMNASFRDLRSKRSCGGFWKKTGNFFAKCGKKVMNIAGGRDFIINIFDDRIDVCYQRVSDNESVMPIEYLAPKQLEREMKRLINSSIAKGSKDYIRLGEAFKKTIDTQFCDMVAEFELAKPSLNEKQLAKERQKLQRRFEKAIGALCKKADRNHLWAVREQVFNLLSDVQTGRIQLEIVSHGVLESSCVSNAQLKCKDSGEGSKQPSDNS